MKLTVKFCCIISLLMWNGFNSAFAQNLIENGDFEYYSQCPDNFGRLYLASPWKNESGSPDYFNSCYNLKYPYKWVGIPPKNAFTNIIHPNLGYGYTGFYLVRYDFSWREYISQSLLPKKLIAGAKYKFSFFLAIDKGEYMKANEIQVCMDSVTCKSYYGRCDGYSSLKCKSKPLIFKIDTAKADRSTGWIYLSEEFTATGNEKKITIGLFENYFSKKQFKVIYKSRNKSDKIIEDRKIAYVYIDDISLEPLNHDLPKKADKSHVVEPSR